jgi:hypothetical protein
LLYGEVRIGSLPQAVAQHLRCVVHAPKGCSVTTSVSKP